MGEARLWPVVLAVAIPIAGGCGSKQSGSATTIQEPTVSGAGAEIPETVAAESTPAFDEEPDEGRPEVIAAVEPEPGTIEDEDEDGRRRQRRDVRMVSYEEAMARPVEVGDATASGGEAQLSAEQVAAFMDAQLDSMYEQCIHKELVRGNELGTVTIDLAIRGSDGLVLGATVEPGRRRFKKCIRGILEDLHFPRFASPRMGARYRFHAG